MFPKTDVNNRRRREIVSKEDENAFPIDGILCVRRAFGERLQSGSNGKFSQTVALLFTSVAPKRRTVSTGGAPTCSIFYTLLLSARVTRRNSQFVGFKMKTDVIRVPTAMNIRINNILARMSASRLDSPLEQLKLETPTDRPTKIPL